MTENQESVISDIKRIFLEGDKKIVLSDTNQVILILGNSGSGKSTLAQLIAGDNDKLVSREKGEGLGDYWIYDENDKISKDDTLLSKTIFPDLVVDPVTKNAFYDCPGFNDNRNSSIDIGGTYFIRKIINHADEIKIILVVNYDSLRQGENRIDLTTLLTHATNLIKNIDKYKESILLVASKVENDPVYNELTDDYDDIEDDDVIIGIATFLQNAKITLKQKVIDAQSGKDKKTNEDSIKLIDVFLSKQGTNYTNIGLFRKSNMAGKVSTIPLLQENKKILNELINNNLKYTRKNNDDFGYTISPTSQMVISDLVEHIHKELSETLTMVATEITTLFRNKEMNIRDIYNLKAVLNTANNKFSKIMNQIKRKEDPRSIIGDIIKGVEEWNIQLTKNNDIKNIANQYDHLDFLQKLATKELMFTKQQIIRPFQEAFKGVQDASAWYDFFTMFYKKLFSYEVQENARKYDKFVETVSEWKRKKSKVFGFFMKQDIKEIVKKVTEFYAIERLEMDDLKLDVLNDIVESAIKNNINITCVGTTLEVRGTWIKTSDLYNDEYYYYHDKCREIINSVEVFALRGFVVDADYSLLDQQIQLGIIAPTWHVMKNSRINNSGRNGYNYPKRSPGPTYPGENGYHGNPGTRGTNSGSFLGIGSKFVDVSKLTIIANGGNGGDGQEGSDGANGRKGLRNSCTWYDGRPNVFERGLRCTVTNPEDPKCYEIGRDDNGIKYVLEGHEGGRAGSGGDGGVPGLPGKHGVIDIIHLKQKPNIKMETKNGYLGRMGAGGKPGMPGFSGDACIGYYYSNWIGTKYWHKIDCGIPYGRFGTFGKYGVNGKNKYRQQNPRSAIPALDSSKLIKKYKMYIKDNFNDRFNMKEYRKFYAELEKIPVIEHNEISSSIDQVRERRHILTNKATPFFPERNSNLTDKQENLKYPNLIDKQENLNNNWKSPYTEFNLNNTLLLIDFAIKKLIGSKPINTYSYDNEKVSLVFLSESLNIVEKFENTLVKFLQTENITKKCIITDFSSLVGKIQTALSKENSVERISKILYNSVPINECTKINQVEISNKLKNIIMKLLKTELYTKSPKLIKPKNYLTKNQLLDIENVRSGNNNIFIDQQNIPLIN